MFCKNSHFYILNEKNFAIFHEWEFFSYELSVRYDVSQGLPLRFSSLLRHNYGGSPSRLDTSSNMLGRPVQRLWTAMNR